MSSSFDRLVGSRPVNDPRIIPFPKMAGYEKLRSPEEKGAFLNKFDELADRWRKSIIIPNGDTEATVTEIVTGMMGSNAGVIATTGPLTGGGSTNESVSLGITQASEDSDGYLSAEDWLIFDSKLDGLPIADDQALLKNAAVDSKTARFDLALLTDNSLRVLSVPDSDLTIAGIDIAQSFSKGQTFIPPNNETAILINPAAMTANDVLHIQIGGTSHLRVKFNGDVEIENGDKATFKDHTLNIGEDELIIKSGEIRFESPGGGAIIGIDTDTSTTMWSIAGDGDIITFGNISFPNPSGSKIGITQTELLAFWGATPIARPLLATGAGATVDNVITVLQTIGLVKQV